MPDNPILQFRREPLRFFGWLWPEVRLYDKQAEVVHSVRDNAETIVVAGNQLGKDWIAGLIILWYFICHHPVKIVTTSATERHLNTLWGEMDRFIRVAKHPLRKEKGGPLVVNNREIRKWVNGQIEKETFISGVVCSNENKGEGLAGHHAPFTLFVVDEASGVMDTAYSMAQGWAKRMLIFGNPNNCSNFFRRAVDGGDVLDDGKVHEPLVNGVV